MFEEYIYAVEVDSVNGLIYWNQHGTFKKTRLDGSNPEVVGKAVSVILNDRTLHMCHLFKTLIHFVVLFI